MKTLLFIFNLLMLVTTSLPAVADDHNSPGYVWNGKQWVPLQPPAATSSDDTNITPSADETIITPADPVYEQPAVVPIYDPPVDVPGYAATRSLVRASRAHEDLERRVREARRVAQLRRLEQLHRLVRERRLVRVMAQPRRVLVRVQPRRVVVIVQPSPQPVRRTR